MRVIAIDTETCLIADRTFVPRRGASIPDADEPRRAARVYTSPFVVPELILGSVYAEDWVLVLDPTGITLACRDALNDPNTHLVFHNIGFDYRVLCLLRPNLEPLFARVANEGRLHDTKILDILYGLSTGRYDMPRYNQSTKKWDVEPLRARSLETLAREYCGITLYKDPEVRLTFAQFRGRPIDQVPERWRAYAAQDALATYKVFRELYKRLGGDLLGEATQIRAALVAAHMDERGIGIDRAAAESLHARFSADVFPLQKQLVAAGLGRWTNAGRAQRVEADVTSVELAGTDWTVSADGSEVVKGIRYKAHGVILHAPAKFSVNVRALQVRLGTLNTDGETPRREDGTLGLDYDFWTKHVPSQAADLCAFLRYIKLQKILSTYLDLYRRVDQVFPRWNVIGARSGRMSASNPSVQNVSKRKYGIRSLFVPRPGHIFIRGDYSAQELYTLCEVMLSLDPPIKGPLYDALVSGEDVHCYAASLVLGRKVEKDDPARQGQKALSFGVPGGLGPRKLADYAYRSYGVEWSEEDAKRARDAFLSAFPDIREYLDRFRTGQDTLLLKHTDHDRRWWRARLGLSEECWNVVRVMCRHGDPDVRRAGEEVDRSQVVRLPSGRVRAHCRFTEAANYGFQGLASDVTKEAVWLAHRAGLRIVLVVHDEVVVESVNEVKFYDRGLLEQCMLEAFRLVCPNIGAYARAEVEIAERWGLATDAQGREI